MSQSRKGTYRDHVAAWEPVDRTKGFPDSARVTLAYGTSEFLLARVVERLRAKAKESFDAPVVAIEANTVSEATIENIANQASLFEPTTLFILQRCEQAKKLPGLLKLFPEVARIGNLLCLGYRGESPAPALRSEAARLKALVIPCFDPWPSDVPAMIPSLAREYGLELTRDAANSLVDFVGPDLVKIGHELTKLSLAFASRGEGAGPLSGRDVSPYLGLLREDDAFQLERLLLARQPARALALAHDLLDRGEKWNALLGLITRHCRTARTIIDAQRRGVRDADLGNEVRLPPFVIKNYAAALRHADPERYQRAMIACQAADMTLKSRPIDEALVIADVIETIC